FGGEDQSVVHLARVVLPAPALNLLSAPLCFERRMGSGCEVDRPEARRRLRRREGGYPVPWPRQLTLDQDRTVLARAKVHVVPGETQQFADPAPGLAAQPEQLLEPVAGYGVEEAAGLLTAQSTQAPHWWGGQGVGRKLGHVPLEQTIPDRLLEGLGECPVDVP